MSATSFNVWAAADTTAHWSTNSRIGTNIQGVGLTKDGASGQIVWTGSQVAGYELFSFADSLQGDFPVHLRIDYTPVGTAYVTGYTFTISTAPNASGQVMGLPMAISTGGRAFDDNEISNCYVSGNTNRLSLALFEGPNIFSYYFLNIERTKDSTGADTNDGIIIQACVGDGAGSADVTRPAGGLINTMLPFSGTVGGYQPVWNTQFNFNSSTLNNDTEIGTLQVVPFNFIPYSPGLGVLLYYGSDYPAYSPTTLEVYGASHTYLPLQNGYSGFGYTGGYAGGPCGNANTHIMMRYE
jgi:hypothetical protein